jgi:hypothetical protein
MFLYAGFRFRMLVSLKILILEVCSSGSKVFFLYIFSEHEFDTLLFKIIEVHQAIPVWLISKIF